MSYTLVEPCCGSAAITLHVLGATRSLLPYQGSKWRFRHAIQAKLEGMGFQGAPSRVVLSDPGPWGRTMGVMLRRGHGSALLEALRDLASRDARAVYDELHGREVPSCDVRFAAEHLFLQRLAFSGKAVGAKGGRWASPGFNVTSAYGVPATESFGEVKPMVPSLIRVVESLVQRLPRNLAVDVRNAPAAAPRGSAENTAVYLDPPYRGSTPYPDGDMSRAQVAELAAAWRHAGAAVIVSEQAGIPLPGWRRERLYEGRDDTSPFRGKQEEWVTYAAAEQLAPAK